MTPRTKTASAAAKRVPTRVARPAHEDIEALNEALDSAERGEGVTLSADELKQWADTGDVSCLDSSPSRRRS